MRSLIQKWGNSLAFRLPKSLASHFGLSSGSEIELLIEGNRLVIVPVSSWESRLDVLLAQINDEQIHPEFDDGHAVGNEFW